MKRLQKKNGQATNRGKKKKQTLEKRITELTVAIKKRERNKQNCSLPSDVAAKVVFLNKKIESLRVELSKL